MPEPDARRDLALRAVLALFDDRPGDAGLPPLEVLWRLQALNGQPRTPVPEGRKKPLPGPSDPALSAAEDQAIREALRAVDPRQDDAACASQELPQRLLRAIDQLLAKWTSGPGQARYGTGTVALPPSPLPAT